MSEKTYILTDSQIKQIRADAINDIHTDLITEIALLNETDMTDVDLYAFAVRIKEITDKLVME